MALAQKVSEVTVAIQRGLIHLRALVSHIVPLTRSVLAPRRL
jgi:hypothetical protein